MNPIIRQTSSSLLGAAGWSSVGRQPAIMVRPMTMTKSAASRSRRTVNSLQTRLFISSSRCSLQPNEQRGHSTSTSTPTSTSDHKDASIADLLPTFGSNQNATKGNVKRKAEDTDETLLLLQSIVNNFRSVRWAIAYGSGIFPQAGYSSVNITDKSKAKKEAVEKEKKKKAPLLDFIFATSHPTHFHALNLSRNPTHYPFWARVLGKRSPGIISLVQSWGAGVWYCTLIPLSISLPHSHESNRQVNIKYGIISTSSLLQDLTDWTTLYVAGRLHKPVRLIQSDPAIEEANRENLKNAVRVAMLSLPEVFSEEEIWRKIAGISYAGDPRMSIPGGENPQKISNIVSAQIPRFRELYGEILNEVAKVERVDSPPPPYSPSAPSPPTAITGSTATATATQQRHQVNNLFGSLSGVEDTEQEEKIVLRQPITPEHRSELLRKLPKKLREALEESFRGRFGAATTDASSSEVPLDPLSESSLFWLRVARETPAKELSADLDQSISRIIRGPATIQSLKGLLTAGVRKSVIYAGEKVRKWWAGRKEKAKALTKEKKN